MKSLRTIELEYRTEIPTKTFNKVKNLLEKKCRQLSHTKRLAYMGFLDLGDKSLDLRSRITNGKSEVVIKKGNFHSSDRIELSQKINKSQVADFARIFSHIAQRNFISERETFNYKTNSGITISLVRSRNIAYIEFEILSNRGDVDNNNAIIKSFMVENGFKPLNKEELNNLNHRLEIHDDWKFNDTREDVRKLQKLLSFY